MARRKERRIVTLTAAQIGTVQDQDRMCAWCRESAAVGYQTTTGISLCDDCADLAREVGDGVLSVEHVTYDGIGYTIAPPLVLTLSVQHDDSGYRWLHAAAPDVRDVLGQMLWNDHGPGVNGADCADISEYVADCLVSPDEVRSLIDSMVDPCNQGSDPAAVRRRMECQQRWDAIHTRITPPPEPAPPEDEGEGARG